MFKCSCFNLLFEMGPFYSYKANVMTHLFHALDVIYSLLITIWNHEKLYF